MLVNESLHVIISNTIVFLMIRVVIILLYVLFLNYQMTEQVFPLLIIQNMLYIHVSYNHTYNSSLQPELSPPALPVRLLAMQSPA